MDQEIPAGKDSKVREGNSGHYKGRNGNDQMKKIGNKESLREQEGGSRELQKSLIFQNRKKST